MSERDKRVEAAARALWHANRRDGKPQTYPYDRLIEPTREDLLGLARATLAAADAAQAPREIHQTRCSGCTERVQDEQPLRFRSGVLWHEACLQPADDRRMVDRIMAVLESDDGRDYTGSWGFTSTHGDEFRAGLRGLFEREFGGSAPSEDWRCECGDLNRDHEAFCYRCGAGQ